MFKNSNNDQFEILRKIHKKQKITQRELADELGFSLGKLNYCIKELKNKGLLKMKNFKDSKKKISYLYALTPSGMTMKKNLVINFMKLKIREYDELKEEMKNKKGS